MLGVLLVGFGVGLAVLLVLLVAALIDNRVIHRRRLGTGTGDDPSPPNQAPRSTDKRS
jgi:hypothetical protein